MKNYLFVFICALPLLAASSASGQEASLEWQDEFRVGSSRIEVAPNGPDEVYVGFGDSDESQAEGFHIAAYSSNGVKFAEARTAAPNHFYSFIGMDVDEQFVYATGTDYGSPHGQVVTAAYKTPSLDESWVEVYSMPNYDQVDAFAIHADGEGNVLVVGLATRFGVNYSEEEDTGLVFVLKYDEFGNLLWAANHGIDMGEFDDQGARDSVGIDSNGNVYVALGKELAKYSPLGALLWKRAVSGSTLLVDAGDCVVITAGMVPSWTSFPAKSLTERIDPNGNTLWSKDIGGFSLASNESGDIWVTGQRAKISLLFRLLLDYQTARIGLDGRIKWTRIYDASRNDFASGIEVDSEGNAYVVGLVEKQNGFFSRSSTPYNDIVKYDPSGRELYSIRHKVTDPVRAGIALEGNDSFYLANDTGVAKYSE